MSSILVAAALREFAARERSEHNIEFFAAQPPVGSYLGIIPTVANRIGPSEIDGLQGLRIIANYGVGYDNIDVAHARDRGIAVTNTPGVLTSATAELTWALILAVARRIGEGERLVRTGEWQGWTPTQLRGMSLEGKLLGIVGAGRLGREVGKRAPAFGMRVIYFGRTPVAGLEFVQLDALLRTADVVSIHLSRSAETERLIGAESLRLMRDGAILVNTARGSIVDENALIREVTSGRIKAGLDVYAQEPRVPEELLSLENVVLLPHLGSATHEARQAMWELAWGNLQACLRGGELLTPVVS
ncbi:MAG TPA: D-glycerate dehydrogenase [Longimicrobiales bacterium]|nr:D-glycerate dehydrogenase [Longimicrobiales bacterium]